MYMNDYNKLKDENQWLEKENIELKKQIIQLIVERIKK